MNAFAQTMKLGTSKAVAGATVVKNHAALAVTKARHFTLGDWGSLASIGGLLYVGYELLRKKK